VWSTTAVEGVRVRPVIWFCWYNGFHWQDILYTLWRPGLNPRPVHVDLWWTGLAVEQAFLKVIWVSPCQYYFSSAQCSYLIHILLTLFKLSNWHYPLIKCLCTLSCNGFLKSRRFLLHDEHKLDRVWGLHSKDTLLLSTVQATELKFSVSWFGGLDLHIKGCVSLKLWWRFCSKSLWSDWNTIQNMDICYGPLSTFKSSGRTLIHL
jgi:hypothetical protein